MNHVTPATYVWASSSCHSFASQYAATHCNTLATHNNIPATHLQPKIEQVRLILSTVTHCIRLQHTCNTCLGKFILPTSPHRATPCNTPATHLQHMFVQVHLGMVMRHIILQHISTKCNTLQHTCNTCLNTFILPWSYVTTP